MRTRRSAAGMIEPVVVAWPAWLPTVSSVQALQGRSPEVGARYVVVQPKLRPTTWVVTELAPPQRSTWEARSPGLPGLPMGWLYRSITERYIAQEVLSLQRKIEGS